MMFLLCIRVMIVKLKAKRCSDLLSKNELLHVDLVAMLIPSSVHIGKPPFSRRVRNVDKFCLGWEIMALCRMN